MVFPPSIFIENDSLDTYRTGEEDSLLESRLARDPAEVRDFPNKQRLFVAENLKDYPWCEQVVFGGIVALIQPDDHTGPPTRDRTTRLVDQRYSRSYRSV